MTLAELADAVGVTGSYLARIELGQLAPTAAVVERIARGLGVSVAALMEAGGRVPAEVAAACKETPEAMLWFASLPSATRKKYAAQGSTDDEVKERARIRRLARRLSDP